MTRLAAMSIGLAALLGGQVASAAELPSRRDARPAKTDAERTCEVNGAPGVPLADGTCLRISGYVTGGVSLGNVKRP